MKYDIIGDIHGQAGRLFALLSHMGYERVNDVWGHEERKVIFLGDFVDRGPKQLAVLETVKAMVDAGSALAVMGNHEVNAIGWHTPTSDASETYLRSHDEKNRRQHTAFLDAVKEFSPLHAKWVSWFKTLPMWLDLGNIRVIHACWDQQAMVTLKPYLTENNTVKEDAWPVLFKEGSPEFLATELLLKGQEVALPDGVFFYDKDYVMRRKTRVKWWLQGGATWRDLVIGDDIAAQLPAVDSHFVGQGYQDKVPVFIGHYWLTGKPECLSPYIACVDYSAASPAGKLVAYRWQGETELTDTHFAYVD